MVRRRRAQPYRGPPPSTPDPRRGVTVTWRLREEEEEEEVEVVVEEVVVVVEEDMVGSPRPKKGKDTRRVAFIPNP